MPFKSKKQRAYLYSQHPEIAKEFESKTSKAQEKKLPLYANKKKKRKKK